ncbi:cytochrome P450 [Mycobacterium intermedium]|uniref:Cytochrome P450 n=1 Tax=Mycobacterium intermedium TaxID=28445 RepID=A0A1E3SFI3_MYCIE|nr:cytochrome P450 [Mycobacterium intermedium]MCV6966209.1 cytochrome P450 [Mycobacterium intermedium]ODR00909.1 cytochrome [Mycobacterium intermedium]OPE52032.1 cytochrome P450 [Mycobacterium intermedium]ORB09801.1 cytochrome P450 [Mycobacterium intermedium]
MVTIAAARFDEPAFYLGDPNATFAQLRDTDPVHWYDEGKFWVITKYDDIKGISARPEKFKSERIGIMMDLIAHREGRDPQGYGTRGIMFMDPPEHRAHRKAIGVRFTPSAVAKLEARVRQVVHDVLDDLPNGEFDWIQRVAEPIPVYVFAYLLGVPEEDWPKVAGWATTIANVGSGVASDEDYTFIFEHIGPYLMGLVAERKEQPRDDLLTMLSTVTIDGEPFNDMEVMIYALTLLAAGSETTQSLIAGLADCLDGHPDQAAKLFAEPSLSGNAVEEVLRYWTPVMSMARQAAQDVELRGVTIKEGDGVLLAYASANRDQDHWGPTAERFEITREDAASHLGFGVGEHFCMGAALARREARLLLEEVTKRAKGIHVVGDRVPRASALVHTHDHLPVVLDYR